jgi:hypothetical protein
MVRRAMDRSLAVADGGYFFPIPMSFIKRLTIT